MVQHWRIFDFSEVGAFHSMKFLDNDILMVEQVGGAIDEVTGKRVTLMAIPPKYKMVEGSQVRVFALM